MRRAFTLLLALFIISTAVWGTLAFCYAGQNTLFLSIAISVIFATFALLAFASIWRTALSNFRLVYLFSLFLMLFWYLNLTPSNERQWQTDVARLSTISVNDHLVTVHNVRNFSYRSEFDYTPAYYDKVYDLNQLKGVDLIAVYWMGPAIAHTLVSFDFGNHHHLAISIEARKQSDETFSTIKGFFRQYELYYVVADERDVIRLRTNHRHNPNEDAYLYRINAPINNVRAMLMQYIKEINALNHAPAFYNSLTTNCTTDIWKVMQANHLQIPFSWQILASGYWPEYLYDQDKLDKQGLSFAALRQTAYINLKAQQSNDTDFSANIRK